MWLVTVDPVVFGAWCKLDVVTNQVQHSSELTSRVVARWGAVTVKIAADPAGSVDNSFKCPGQFSRFSRGDFQCREYGVVFRTVCDDDVILTRRQSLCCISQWYITQTFDPKIAALWTKPRLSCSFLRKEVDLAWDRFSTDIG